MNRGGALVVLIASCLIVGSLIAIPAPAEGALRAPVVLVPSRYTNINNTYVPGETMEIIINADEGDTYSFRVVYGEGAGQDLGVIGSVYVSDMSFGVARFSFNIPDTYPDGVWRIDTYSDIGLLLNSTYFNIQKYRFVIETDRTAYLGGDTVNIFWSANNLKDESLTPDGYGKLVVVDSSGKTLGGTPFSFTSASGSFFFNLGSIVRPELNYSVHGWFNNSASSEPERSQSDSKTFNVGNLSAIISLDAAVYAPQSLLVGTLKTVVTDNAENPKLSDAAEPNCVLEVNVLKKSGTSFNPPSYYNLSLVSDAHGYARFAFQLDHPIFVHDSEFMLWVKATKGSYSWIESGFFSISETAGLSIVLGFNKMEYASGDTIFVNTSVSTIGSGTGSTFTYIYEVRDGGMDGNLLAKTTADIAIFNYHVGSNFEGLLWFEVTVDDGRGNKANATKLLDIRYALVLVNADLERYQPGDIISVEYEIVGELMANATAFYRVTDTDGYSVSEGSVIGGSFAFVVPNAPSERYTFSVMAYKDGHLISGHDIAEQLYGYVILIELNRAAYAPGDTMAIKYTVVRLGDAPLPATFDISYGLANGPTKSIQSSESSGTLTYTIPETIDEGVQPFWIYSSGGGTTSQLVTVKENPNPLWFSAVYDLPLFDIILLALLLLCLALIYRNHRRIRHQYAEEPEELYTLKKSPAQKRKRSVSAPSHSVPCDSCGAAIEISTSKRPIEVMCPSCGETQIITK